MSGPTQSPKDALGNELHEGDIVSVFSTQHTIMRVLKLDNGGVHTPGQGVTPAVVIVGVTLTIRAIPGAPILNVVKVVAPGNDELVSKLLDSN